MKVFRRDRFVAIQCFLESAGMRCVRSEEGQSMVMIALSLTVLMGFLALATDVGVLLRQRRIAQTVADSAALAGAFQSMYESNPSTVSASMYDAAKRDAILNGFTPGDSNGVTNSSTGVTLNVAITPNISVTGYNSTGNVQASVSLNALPIFMNFFSFKPLTVGATAIATNMISADGCFYVNNGGNYADPAVTMSGSSEVFGQNCGVTINGNADLSGSSNITAKFVAASGGLNLGDKGATITGQQSSNTGAPTPDPLSKLQDPANQPTIDTKNKTCAAPTNSPGMLCSYNYQNGNLSGTLPGNTIYVFDNNVTTTCGNGGKAIPCVLINNSVSSGTGGVTLYLSPNMPLDYYSNGAAILSPPEPTGGCIGSTNPLCGILIDAPTDGSGGGNNGTYTCSSGKGNNGGNPGELYFDFGSSKTVLNGIIYAPYMQMFVQDQGAQTTLNNDLVIGNLCSQAATLTVNAFSGSQSPLTRVGLVY